MFEAVWAESHQRIIYGTNKHRSSSEAIGTSASVDAKNIKPKIPALILAFILTFGVFPGGAAAASNTQVDSVFNDVTEKTTYHDAIYKLQASGFIMGDGSGKYEPDGILTPAAAITILERKFGNKSNLPSSWSGWDDHGSGYKGTWLDRSDILGDFINYAVTKELAAKMVLQIKSISILPANLYDMPLNANNTNCQNYASLLIYGYKPANLDVSSINYPITRGEFCEMVLWADSLTQTVPEYKAPAPFDITIQTTGTEYQKAVIKANIISSLTQIPASVLQKFKADGYTFSYISNGTVSADPAGRYYNAGGTGGYITVKSASSRVIAHEFGHFVFDHSDISAEIEGLLKDPKELAGVKLISASDYCKTSPSEFFAEAFYCYINFPGMLKTNSPGTFTLIGGLFN